MGSPESHPKPPLPKTRERHRAHQEGGSGTHYAGSSSSLKEGLLETHHASRSRQPSSSHAANSSRGPVRSSLQRGMMWVVALALCSFCFLETWRRVSFLLSPAAILGFDAQLLPLVADPSHPALLRTTFVLPERRESQRKGGGEDQTGQFAARSVHWVSLAEGRRPGDLVAAFVGGTWEGKPDTAVYVADYDQQTDAWSEPRLVASAAVHKRPGARPGAVWYPVLCRGSSGSGRGKEGATGGGLLLLMYKFGTPVDWVGFQAVSLDDGNSWATPAPMNFTGAPGYGPFHACVNLPAASDGGDNPMILMGSRSMTDTGVGIHLELSNDNGGTWNRTTSIPFEGGSISNPSLFLDGGGGVRMLAQHRAFRPSHSRAVMVVGDRSGLRWDLAREVDLPNMDSPLDAIRLADGRVLAVYNHVNRTGLGGRKVLNVGLSYDEGETWGVVMTLEFDEKRIGREFGNPAVVQTSDGLVHVCYVHSLVRTAPGPMTGRENLKHVTLDPKYLDEEYFAWLREKTKWPLPHDAAINKGSSGATELQILEKDAAAKIKLAVTVRHRIEANRANAERNKAAGASVQVRSRPSRAQERREARRRSAEETDAMARDAAQAAAAEVEALLSKDPADAGEKAVPRVAATDARLETLDVIRDKDMVEFDNGTTSAGTEGYAVDESAPKTRARRRRRRRESR